MKKEFDARAPLIREALEAYKRVLLEKSPENGNAKSEIEAVDEAERNMNRYVLDIHAFIQEYAAVCKALRFYVDDLKKAGAKDYEIERVQDLVKDCK